MRASVGADLLSGLAVAPLPILIALDVLEILHIVLLVEEFADDATLDHFGLLQLPQQSVTLNPRYGVLDEKQKLIVTDESGSLARPASPRAAQTP